MQNAEYDQWLNALRMRNAYYHGIFAARKARDRSLILQCPKANSWEENIYWRLGVYDGESAGIPESGPDVDTMQSGAMSLSATEADLSAFDL